MWLIIQSIFTTCMIFFISLIITYFRRKRSKYLRNLPGPKPNLFFGNLLDFLGPRCGYITRALEYSQKYGTVFKMHDGPFSTVVVISDEKFLAYLLCSVKFSTKANQYKYSEKWLGTGLVVSNGTKWQKRRKLLTPSFHFSILENYIDIFESVGDVLIKKLDKEVGKDSFDIYPLVSLYTLDTICEAAMGVSINAQLNENSNYIKNVKLMCEIVIGRIVSPLYDWLYPFSINYYREMFAVKFLHAHTYAIIDKRMEQLNTTAGEDKVKGQKGLAFLDLLLQYTMDGEPLSRSDIREEVDTFMFAGHDTTTSAIGFALYCLANNPSIQEKVLEEQKIIFNGIQNPKVTLADVQKMRYLEMVIKESLRLYPPVFGFGRQVLEDFEWNGVLYPKNLRLALIPFLTHRNPKYYPEPERFIPERFNETENKRPFTYLPFSAGPRNCIGQKFAWLEMKSIISKVIRNFELRPSTPAHYLQLVANIILTSNNGIKISLKRRSYEVNGV